MNRWKSIMDKEAKVDLGPLSYFAHEKKEIAIVISFFAAGNVKRMVQMFVYSDGTHIWRKQLLDGEE